MDYGKLMTEQILPKWMEFTPDRPCGGSFTVFDRNHNPKPDALKDVWFFGRAMWSYAMAHRLYGAKQEYLDICAHLFAFLKKCTLPNGKQPRHVTRDGVAVNTPKRTCYVEMFSAMGCAQYFRISGDPEVKAYAELYYRFVHNCYMGLLDTNQEENSPTVCKVFGLHMATLAAAQFVRNAGICVEEAGLACRTAVEQLMTGGFVDDENRCIHEHVALDGSLLPGELGQVSCPGHIYEAAWFVMSEGEVQNSDAIRNFGRKLLDYAMPEGFEQTSKLIPTIWYLDKGLADETDKGDFLGWPQQEAAIAFRLGYQLFGNAKYLELSDMFVKECFDYYDRFEGTIWYRDIFKQNGDYISSLDTGHHINGPFHFARFLMAMDAMTKTGSIMPYMQ